MRPIETHRRRAPTFCEVFYDEVRIPLANVVGRDRRRLERGDVHALVRARHRIHGQPGPSAKVVEDLIEFSRDHVGPDGRRPAIADDEIAARLARARAAVTSLRAMTYVGICRSMRTDTPGPKGSMLKLFYADLAKQVAELAMDIIGTNSLRSTSRWDKNGWVGNYLYAFSQSIGGGTSEIQRNIVGDRVLGLPR